MRVPTRASFDHRDIVSDAVGDACDLTEVMLDAISPMTADQCAWSQSDHEGGEQSCIGFRADTVLADEIVALHRNLLSEPQISGRRA